MGDFYFHSLNIFIEPIFTDWFYYNMIYPTLLKKESDLYSLSQEDKTLNAMRASFHFNKVFFIHILKHYEIIFSGLDNIHLEKNLREAFHEKVLAPPNSLIVATHDLRSDTINLAMSDLLKKVHATRLPQYSEILNYLTILTTPSADNSHVEFVDIIKWDGAPLYDTIPYLQRIKNLRDKLETELGSIYVDDNKTVFLSIAKPIEISPSNLDIKYSEFIETWWSDCVKVIIYGEKNIYSIYNSRIYDIERILSLSSIIFPAGSTYSFLENLITNNDVLWPLEFNQLKMMLVNDSTL